MKRNMWLLITLLVIASFSLFLVACGGDATEEPDAGIGDDVTEPEPDAEVVEEPDEEVVDEEVVDEEEAPAGTIRVGTWESVDQLSPWNDVIANFEAENPGIDIQLEAVPQDYGTKLLAQFAAGTAPDIYQVGDGDVATFVSQGVVEPLDPYISGPDGIDTSIYYPAIAEFGELEGETMLLTKDYSPLVLYYNIDHFDEAGLDYPTPDWTWDDMLNAAQVLTIDGDGNNATSPDFDAGNIERWGIQIPNTWGDVVWLRGLLPLIYQAGGHVIAEDGSATEGYMNSPETVSAVQYYVDLFNEHHVAPTAVDVDSFSGVDMFGTGLVSMAWSGRWPIADWTAIPDLNFGTMGLPSGPAGEGNALCWAGFAMYSEGENKEAAWEFMKYIGAGDGALAFSENALPAVASYSEDLGLAEDEYSGPILEDLANVQQIPEFYHPRWLACGEANFKEQLERVFLEGISVQEAMDTAAANADACLAEDAPSG